MRHTRRTKKFRKYRGGMDEIRPPTPAQILERARERARQEAIRSETERIAAALERIRVAEEENIVAIQGLIGDLQTSSVLSPVITRIDNQSAHNRTTRNRVRNQFAMTRST